MGAATDDRRCAGIDRRTAELLEIVVGFAVARGTDAVGMSHHYNGVRLGTSRGDV